MDSRSDVIKAQARREREAARKPAPFQEADPEKERGLRAMVREFPGADSGQQELRLQEALARFGSINTFEAARHLDLYHPPARVLGLRQRGVDILTTWVQVRTESGRLHRIGAYSLVKGGQRGEPTDAEQSTLGEASGEAKVTNYGH